MATPQEEGKKKVEQAPAQVAGTQRAMRPPEPKPASQSTQDPSTESSQAKPAKMERTRLSSKVELPNDPKVNTQRSSWADGMGGVKTLEGVQAQRLSNGEVLMAPESHVDGENAPRAGTTVAEVNDANMTGVNATRLDTTPPAKFTPYKDDSLYAKWIRPEKESEADRIQREKREKNRAMWAAFGDGISALANIWGTANGAVNTSDGSGLSARASALLAKETEAREKRYADNQAWNIALREKDRAAKRQAQLDEWQRKQEAEKLEETKQKNAINEDYKRSQIRLNEVKQLKANREADLLDCKKQWYAALTQSQINRNNRAGQSSGSNGPNKSIQTKQFEADWIGRFSNLGLPMNYLKETSNGGFTTGTLTTQQMMAVVDYVHDNGALPAWYIKLQRAVDEDWAIPDLSHMKGGGKQAQAKPASGQQQGGKKKTGVQWK